MSRHDALTEGADAGPVCRPLPPAGEAIPAQWQFPAGLADFPGARAFRFWRRAAGSPVGVLHPAGRPEEGLLLGEACALGCAVPLRLTAAEQALLGDPPPEGLAFFLCLGALPEEPGRAWLRICAVLAVALAGGRALRLSLPQEQLPESLPMKWSSSPARRTCRGVGPPSRAGRRISGMEAAGRARVAVGLSSPLSAIRRYFYQ